MQNKHLNRMKAVAMSSAALIGMGVMPSMTVLAAPASVNITINDGKDAADSTYVAYRVLDLETKLKDEADESGEKYNYRYTINDKYGAAVKAALKTVFGKEDFDDKEGFDGRDMQAALVDASEENVRAFADALYKEIRKANLEADATASNKKFSDAAQGYYLIVETVAGAQPDSISLTMLDTLGQEDITVNTKEDVPTLKKELITGQNGGETSKVGDLGINADANRAGFRLTGTMPANIGNYKTYKYVFHDKLPEGLQFDAGSVKVKVDGTLIDASKYEVDTTACDFGCAFHVSFDDIKACGQAITADSEVVVEYEATLTDKALIGQPNVNAAKLEFSNDPYYDGEGDEPTGETPEDETYTFTYQVVVNKTDENGKALEGAEFKLSMKVNGEWKELQRFVFGDSEAQFKFERLDSGTYKLEETKAPAGYVSIDPIVFEIGKTFGDKTVTDLTAGTTSETVAPAEFTVDLSQGKVSTTVENTPGKKLPSTGGSGTVALYVGGGIMLAGGLSVLVVSKKRKDKMAD